MKRFQFYGDSNVTLISPLKCTVNIYTMECSYCLKGSILLYGM